MRFCKPGFFCVRDELSSLDGQPHDYEILFHLDTLKTRPLPGCPNGVISDFGKEYDVALIPLDDESAPVTLEQVSAQMEPVCQGWYVGRNDCDLHAAATVSRKVCRVMDFRFTTLLIPVRAGAPLPQVSKADDGTVTVTLEEKTYRFNLNQLNQ